MPQCKNTVETETGLFTIHDEKFTRGAAKLKCAESGEILAPLTNQKDVQALVDAITSPNCPFPLGQS